MKRLFSFMALLAEEDLDKSCQTCPPLPANTCAFSKVSSEQGLHKDDQDFLPILLLHTKKKGLGMHPIDASIGFG